MEEPRHFNKISVIDEYTIEKSSSDKKKIEAECLWYENNSRFPSPIIYDGYKDCGDYASYTMEYVHGNTLSEIFLSKCECEIKYSDIDYILFSIYKILTDDTSNNLLTNIFEYTIPITYYTGFNRVLIESLYSEKTYRRLSDAKIDLNKHYVINGKSTPTIREIIENSHVSVSDEDIWYIHGDPCFSNIIINNSSVKVSPFFIDPRGYLDNGEFSNIGDIKYDIGKLAHSVIGRYDQIKSDNGFELIKEGDYRYRYEIETTPIQRHFEITFKELFKDYDYYNVMIHLFLSMIPLHSDRPDHQEKMLINAIRLYIEKDNFLRD